MKAFVILCVLGLASAQGGYQRRGHSYSFSSPSNGVMDSYGNYVGQPSYTSVPHRSYERTQSAPGVSKRFFTFIAEDNDDDEDYDDYSYGQQRGPSSQDVIFAKAPVQSTRSLANALRRAVRAAPSVHVLSQKPSASQVNGAFHASGISHNKPDVHFHNYRTPDEFAHITQQIKAQYESLGGSTEDFGSQTVPVQSYGSRGSFGGNGPQVSFLKYRTPDEAANIIQHIKGQYEAFGGPTQDFGAENVRVESGNQYRQQQYYGNNANYHVPSSSHQQNNYHAPSSHYQQTNYHVPSVNNRVSVPSGHYQQSSYNVPSVNPQVSHYHQTNYNHKSPVPASSTTFLTPVSNYLPPKH